MPSAPPTWEETTAVEPTWEETAPVEPKFDAAKFQGTPEYKLAKLASLTDPNTGLKRESGMDPGTELTTAVAENPIGAIGTVASVPFRAAVGAAGAVLNPLLRRKSPEFGESQEEFEARRDPIQYGKSFAPHKETSLMPEGTDAGRLLERWTTPEGILMIPAGMTRIGATALMAQMAPGLVQQISDTAKGGGSEIEKRDRINDLFALGLMVSGGGSAKSIREGLKAPPEEAPLPTGESLKMTKGSPVPPKVPFNLPDAAKAPEPPVVPAEPVAPPVEGAKANPHDFVPAIQDVAGDNLIGEKGKSHEHILQTQKAEDYDWLTANFEHVRAGEMKGRGFWWKAGNGGKGEFVTRERASELLGEKEPLHSERLDALQKETPEPKPAAPPAPTAAAPAAPPSNIGTQPPVDTTIPLKPKKPYNMANLRAPAQEFTDLIMQHGEEHGWIEHPDFIAPGATGYAMISHNTEMARAFKRAFKQLGIETDRNTLKAKAEALPKLKAFLEAHAKTVETPMEQIKDGGTFTIAGEKYKAKGTDPDTGILTLVDGKTLKVPMEGSIKIDPGSLKKPAGEDFGLAEPESVEEQKARLESEKAAALKKSQAATVQAGAAKPLVGSVGEIRQGDMLDDELFNRAPSKPAAPGEGMPPGQPLGFGGGVGPPRPPAPPAADPTPSPSPITPEEVAAIQTQKTPGLLGSIAQGIKSLLLPSSKGPASLKAAELLGSKLGPMHQRGESSAAVLRPASRMFDKLGVHREGVAPADNLGIRFMSDMSQGRPLTGKMKVASDLVQRLFAARLESLDKAGAPLQTVRENYFPGMWTRESRLAFNAVMERMGKDFDLETATPEQKANIRAQVDKLIEDGIGSEKDALGFLTRKPLKGKESFRKQKVFDDIMDGAELGLRPISNNPIDLVMLKLAEMDKSIMANQFFKDPRAGVEVINPYEEVGPGRVKINDKYGTIYGKPTVTIPEYIDQKVYQGLLKIAAALGISHERLMRFPPGPGNRALGLSYTGQNRILSRFGTETSVIAHEIGHQLDAKYSLWQRLTGGGKGSERSVEQNELRAIADETERGKKARKKEEKMAQVMEIYIHAPERMKEIAPRIYNRFHTFVQETPELKSFSEIRPGIALTKLTGEKYVGLPIMGYRTVPEAVGEVLNNYLSSSLYNNRYFGPLYKGWMTTANALNQTQLGMGSAFHAGFTTGEAQISSSANVLKDIYGVLRGNRSVTDLGKSIGKTAVGTIRNPVIGDQVLNAWRNPEGTINPRIAQVVRAAELGGGGFKMESGLRTEQSTKLLRDWYSGHRLRAAARSPIALTELLAKPTMEYLVPRQKAGVFADLAWRIIEQNPGKALEELTPQFRQAWNRVDARLGQVRYDRLFINNTAKNVVQGLVRAPGWSGGTIAEIGGGFADAGRFMSEWVKTGKLPENLPDRTAYVISLLTTVGAVNAALTYTFTGTTPHGLDFFAFRTGNKNEQGREERFLIPSYVKDMLAYARHPGETLLNKSHPLLSILSDIAKNKDYYGVEVRSRDEGAVKQAGQTAAYVIKGFEPFWTRGARREIQRGASLVSPRTVAPFFGIMPAPRAVTQTPAESLAHDLMMEQIPSGPRTRAQADRSQAKAKLNQGTDYLVRTVKRLNATAAVRVWQKANNDERTKIGAEVSAKIWNSKTLSEAEKQTLRKRMAPNGTPSTPPWFK